MNIIYVITSADGPRTIEVPAAHTIILSISTNTVPQDLKAARVKPLYKKQSRFEACNYRPVSILNALSKILERAVYFQLEKHLSDNNILYEYQSGFRGSYSTDTCLMYISDYIRTEISHGNYVGMLLLDLQKAFDTVDHTILCKKLDAMGVISVD